MSPAAAAPSAANKITVALPFPLKLPVGVPLEVSRAGNHKRNERPQPFPCYRIPSLVAFETKNSLFIDSLTATKRRGSVVCYHIYITVS